MSAVLQLSQVNAGYGAIRVLHGVTLEVGEGSVTALLGANGAGKTTTLRAISALVRAQGEVRFEGERIDRLAPEDVARRGIAHVPAARGTFERLTVEENLVVGALARRAPRECAEDLERVYGYFPRLKERRVQQAGTLSGGEQQMLAVSRALMLRPKLMLLDEPSFGLAPRVVEELFAMLEKIRHDAAVSMLLVEQNAALALALAERAYVLETGRIVKAGPARVLREDDAVRRAYLGY